MRDVRFPFPALCFGALALALAGAAGCKRKEQPKPRPLHGPEPIVPSANVGGAPPTAERMLLDELPQQAVSAEPDGRVWATLLEPETAMASVGVFTVVSVGDQRATLIDELGHKTREVPGALIHPVGSAKHLKAGDLALCYSFTAPGVLGRVLKVRGGRAVVQYDWSGTTKQAVVEHAEPAITDVAPLAFVGYPSFGAQSKGLVIALSDDQAWLRTGSGTVAKLPRTELVELGIRTEPYRVGDAVEAYRWTSGYRRGTIREIVEPRLRYSVQPELGSERQTYFFTDLIPASQHDL